MTSTIQPMKLQALRRAAVRAALAPSVHNTQPWRFAIADDSLEIHADRDRQLTVLDPTGRQLVISCGCAILNARAALAAAGYRAVLVRFPDPSRPSLLATLRITDDEGSLDHSLASLDPMIELRRTNRRRFAEDEVPEELVAELVAAAAGEGARLVPITRSVDRISLAVLSQRADAQQNADPGYRAELRAWTTDDARRNDGVPAMAVPHGGPGSHDDVPIRDFDTDGAGSLPTETYSDLNQCLLLLGTEQDSTEAWLRAGQALERVLLEVTRHGYAASPFTQVIESPGTRALLRSELRLRLQPQLILRIGRAPATPATRRRRLVDILTESS